MKISRKNYILYTALLVWAVFSICMALYNYGNFDRSVYPLYFNVGNAWNAGSDIYSGDCANYSYWPGFALIFAVLAKLPYNMGSVVWTLLNLGAIFYGMYLLGRSIFSSSANRCGLFLLLGLPLIFEGIFNQQSNALVAGISLIGMCLIYREKFMLGSLLLLFSGISKIAPLSFALLFLVMYPRQLWWRYLLGLFVLFSVPAFIAGPGYFLELHRSWFSFLTEQSFERWEYRDFFLLYELVTKGKISTNTMADFPLWYHGVQVLGAGLLCLVCIWLRYWRRYNRESILAAVAMAGSVWWLLLGPSTEIATCVAGVAIAGLGVMLAWDSRSGRWLQLLAYICVVLGSSGDYEWNMEQLTTSDWIYGMLPFGALLMYVWYCLFMPKALALTTGTKAVR